MLALEDMMGGGNALAGLVFHFVVIALPPSKFKDPISLRKTGLRHRDLHKIVR